jgi:superfamily II DNA/RNA helicase
MSFDAFGFIPPINRAIQRINYETATPIQQQCIPLILEGKDVLASARIQFAIITDGFQKN